MPPSPVDKSYSTVMAATGGPGPKHIISSTESDGPEKAIDNLDGLIKSGRTTRTPASNGPSDRARKYKEAVSQAPKHDAV